jgi:hypothetical protein
MCLTLGLLAAAIQFVLAMTLGEQTAWGFFGGEIFTWIVALIFLLT